ncbi:hypothetical protein MRX96_001649 [Rhipicephalus microplus]
MFAQVLLHALGLLSTVTLEWVVLPQAGEKEGPPSFCGLSLDVLFAAPPCLDTSLPFIRQHGKASDNPAVGKSTHFDGSLGHGTAFSAQRSLTMFAQVLLHALGLLSPVTLEWVVLPQAGEKEGPPSFCGLSLDVLFAAPPCLDTSLPFIRQHGKASDNPAVATPGTDPDVDAVVNELEEYKVVVRNSLGSHTLLMGATIKAVDPRYEPGSPKGYVVFRTQRMFPTDRRWFNFRRHKLLE